jgi:hypothetical protein
LAFMEAARAQMAHSDTLTAWSDSCSGQNKNFTVVCFWELMLAMKQFAVIEHKFPEVGHSYMDSDRDFGLIEKTVSKVERVFSGDEYRELIKKAKTRQPFVVQNIASAMIKAKNLPKLLRLVKRQRNTNREKVEFRNIRWFRYEKFGYYKYRLSFDANEPWKEVDLRGHRFASNVDIDLSSQELVITGQKHVNALKVDDIQKMLPYIPRIHQQFYRQLMVSGADSSATSAYSEEDNEDDGNDD